MIGSILHDEAIGIWDNEGTWTLQTAINIDYSSGNAIIGAGSDFSLVQGVEFDADIIIRFRVADNQTNNNIVFGHGLSNEVIDGNMIPQISNIITVKEDGYYTLKYSGKVSGANIYNVFYLKTQNVPTIEVEEVALVFRAL